jgi:tetratricopeptide (TPR) repeat protein/CHAT domain-containing protein
MLRQVGQWLKRLWQWVAGLFAKGKPAPAPPPPAVPPLSDTAYENLFMQLMDGVGEGWDGARVREHLGNRSDDSWFANWLRRFGRDTLLASPQPNNELARRMVRLGEIGCGKFGEIAGEFGKQRLAKNAEPLAEGEWEFLFGSLLERVALGDEPVLAFLEDLQHRAILQLWVEWLRNYGERLLAADVAERDLARRMARLGEIAGGELGEVARDLGSRLLERVPVEDEVWEIIEAVFVGNGLGVAGDVNRQDAEGAEEEGGGNQEAEAWFYLGLQQAMAENIEGAIASFNQALAIKPDYYEALSCLGGMQVLLKQLEPAIASYNKVLAIKPEDHEAFYNRGCAQADLGELEAAIVSYNQALAIKPDFPEALYSQGLAQAMLGQLEPAIASYNQALAIKPDFYEVLHNRGLAQAMLGQFEPAISSYNQALAIKPDFPEALFYRGLAQYKLGQLEPAIASWNQALAIKPDDHNALYSRGKAQADLGQLEPAIDSYNQALAIKPDFPEAWYNRGLAQAKLGQLEPAIASWNEALAIKPDYHEALHNRGLAQAMLGQFEPAIASHNQALTIKPDFYEAWYNRGYAQANLGQFEPAIASYNQALTIKPDYHEALLNRGYAQGELGQFESAIASYDAALALKRDLWEAWWNRGMVAGQSISPLQGRLNPLLATSPLARENPELNRRGYEGALASYEEGLKHCHRDTHPEGWGQLHWRIGDAHYKRGIGDARRRHYWKKALNSYNTALQTLTETAFPEAHLDVLDNLMRVWRWLGEKEQADELHRHAKELLRRLLAEPKRSDWEKKQLALKFAGFQQLTVDECVRNGEPVRAWELAEQGKNACLTWLLYAWSEDIPTASWDDIQQLLNPSTAAIYWHQSPVALHTFIIKHSAPEPIVLGATPDSRTETASPLSDSPSPHAEMEPGGEVLFQTRLQEFEAWVKEWNQQYEDYRNPKEKGAAEDDNKSHPWYAGMEERLQRLGEILDIPAILEQVAGIPQLILIPHRDLHPLPLEYLFPDRLTLTRLPSAQIGKMLSAAPAFPSPPNPEKILLSAETPDSKKFLDLPLADVESAAIAQMFPPTGITRISGKKVKNTTLKEYLQQPHRIFHFTGHGVANISNPAFSYLALAGEEKLTVEDILSIKLDGYDLISLSACETALTRNQTITAEYVGLVSGFLRAGAAGAFTTLWVVPSNASALMTIQFYRQLKKGRSQAVARANAVKWLKQLTPKKLSRLYKAALAKLPLYEDTVRPTVETELTTLAQQEEQDGKLFQHPYYWAAFTIAGTFQ